MDVRDLILQVNPMTRIVCEEKEILILAYKRDVGHLDYGFASQILIQRNCMAGIKGGCHPKHLAVHIKALRQPLPKLYGC